MDLFEQAGASLALAEPLEKCRKTRVWVAAWRAEGAPVPVQGARGGVRYTLPSGRHRVRLMDGPEVRYDRYIFVSAGQGVRIEVPQ